MFTTVPRKLSRIIELVFIWYFTRYDVLSRKVLRTTEKAPDLPLLVTRGSSLERHNNTD